MRLDTRFVSDPKLQALVRPYIAGSRKRIERKLPVGLSARAGSHGELANASQEKLDVRQHRGLRALPPQGRGAVPDHRPRLRGGHPGEQGAPARSRAACAATAPASIAPAAPATSPPPPTSSRDVGCESCHGPSATHIRTQNKTGTRRQVPESVCLECHTDEQSPEPFDYAAAMKEVLGPGHGFPAAKSRP